MNNDTFFLLDLHKNELKFLQVEIINISVTNIVSIYHSFTS